MAEFIQGDPTSGSCKGAHRFFAADMVGNHSTGVVQLPLVCTVCGSMVLHRFEASAGLTFLEHEKTEKEI